MILSSEQVRRFWREWSAACANQGWTEANGWTKAQIENERHSLLDRAGFESLTLVDKTHGFDRVLEELKTLREDLAGMERARNNYRVRLIFRINEYARKRCGKTPALGSPEAYIRKIAMDRFGTFDLQDLGDASLIQLRNTLADRCVEQHDNPTLARRASKNSQRRQAKAQQPPDRIKLAPPPPPSSDPSDRSYQSEEMFPDQVHFPITDGQEVETIAADNTPF